MDSKWRNNSSTNFSACCDLIHPQILSSFSRGSEDTVFYLFCGIKVANSTVLSRLLISSVISTSIGYLLKSIYLDKWMFEKVNFAKYSFSFLVIDLRLANRSWRELTTTAGFTEEWSLRNGQSSPELQMVEMDFLGCSASYY